MDTKRLLTGMVVLLAGSAMVQEAAAREVLPSKIDAALVQAQLVTASDDLNGFTADVYRLECFARKMQANVSDIGDFNDSKFLVTLTGSRGGPGFAGKSNTKVSPKGGTSGFASLQRTAVSNADLLGYALIAEVDGPGFEKYTLGAQCVTATGGAVNPTITKILDQ
ncbi:MAG: hypothetical protein ACREYF_22950 [Gammaproteobacteria bacterium]